jgi:DNA-binding beta-propeller fold protein YncE
VTNDLGNSLTPIDPRTGRPGRPIPVADPYNMYFTADGRWAVVVSEARRELDFRDARTMALHHALPTPQCRGVDHMDFTASGRYALVSCEFSGRAIVVDMKSERVVRVIPLATGAHGLYPSRNAKDLYVSNRAEGSISVISFATRRPIAKWWLPNGSSPDMGGVSANGRILWLSGRSDSAVYAISTQTGRLLHRIPVGNGPHGLCVWPQPGRYSIGHTGILR